MAITSNLITIKALDLTNLSILPVAKLRKIASLFNAPSSVRNKPALIDFIITEKAALDVFLTPPTDPTPLTSVHYVETPSAAPQPVGPKRSVQEQADFIVTSLKNLTPTAVAEIVDRNERANFTLLTVIKSRRPTIDKLLPQTDSIAAFKTSLRVLQAAATAQINATYATNVQKAALEPVVVDTTRLIEKVLLLCNKVANGYSPSVSDAMLVVGIVTGRRLIECTDAFSFKVTGEYKMLFSGQLKKGDFRSEAFEIPTLVPAPTVAKFLDVIASQTLPIHISESMGAVCRKVGIKSFKVLRALYIKMVLHLIDEKHLVDTAAVITKILGHVAAEQISTSFMSYSTTTLKNIDDATKLRMQIKVDEIRNLL
jgi:hypothetical protein